jgi:hypothetical protein
MDSLHKIETGIARQLAAIESVSGLHDGNTD